MATTTIHAIKTTPNLALAYAQRDKEESVDSDKEISADISHYFFERNERRDLLYTVRLIHIRIAMQTTQ